MHCSRPVLGGPGRPPSLLWPLSPPPALVQMTKPGSEDPACTAWKSLFLWGPSHIFKLTGGSAAHICAERTEGSRRLCLPVEGPSALLSQVFWLPGVGRGRDPDEVTTQRGTLRAVTGLAGWDGVRRVLGGFCEASDFAVIVFQFVSGAARGRGALPQSRGSCRLIFEVGGGRRGRPPAVAPSAVCAGHLSAHPKVSIPAALVLPDTSPVKQSQRRMAVTATARCPGPRVSVPELGCHRQSRQLSRWTP